MRSPLPVGLALLTLLSYAPLAGAHALGAECKLRDGRVEVEGYFSDDSPARGARVTVRDDAGQAIADGRTDDHGRWSFPAPKPGKYRVAVDAGDGHRATVGVTIPDATPAADPVADNAPVVSEGPDRTEFTRTPWRKLAVGFAVIALAAGAGRWLLRQRPPVSPDASAKRRETL